MVHFAKPRFNGIPSLLVIRSEPMMKGMRWNITWLLCGLGKEEWYSEGYGIGMWKVKWVVFLWLDYVNRVCVFPTAIQCCVTSYFLLTMSMNYAFSLSNGRDSRLYNHTGDIIHAFTHDWDGIRARTDAVLDYVAASVRVRILRPS